MLLARLRSTHPELIVLMGHGDPLCAGVHGALLTEYLRRLAEVPGDALPEVAQAQLQKLLRRVLPAQQLERCLVPLCELGALPGSPTLPIPLPERGVLREPTEQAFVQLMRALSETGPILIVLEDLHYADPLSVRVLDRVLGELAERPLMILALARPEVHAIFPKLWAEHRVQELRLEPLLPAACEQLIEIVLGPGAEAAPHILQLSRGKALFLEELLLVSAREPLTRQLPATLIMLVQERLLRLPAHALQVLRAASVFGMHFWEEGVHALLAPLLSLQQIDSGLRILLDAGLVFRQRASRFPTTSELGFHSALALFAVTQLLREVDRELGRAVAARYI